VRLHGRFLLGDHKTIKIRPSSRPKVPRLRVELRYAEQRCRARGLVVLDFPSSFTVDVWGVEIRGPGLGFLSHDGRVGDGLKLLDELCIGSGD
jgi:hypothetical protein